MSSTNQQPQPSEPPREPADYDLTRVTFRTDHSGNPIVVRPGQFLAKQRGEDGRPMEELVREILAEIRDIDVDVEPRYRFETGEPIRGGWRRYRLLVDALVGTERVEVPDPTVDVIRLIRGLRERGVTAQPNHVYFADSLQSNASSRFNPNMFAPNMFAPNMFAPNMFAPNMFAPNMFAPNMFAGGLGGGGGCCCPGPLAASGAVAVPRHAARPFPRAELPDDVAARLPDDVLESFEADRHREARRLERIRTAPSPIETSVEIHVIDIATPRPKPESAGGSDTETGELKQPGFLQRDAVDENGDHWVDPAMGHGDFVRCIVELNSGLKTTLWEAADPLGDIDDTWLVVALQEVDARVGSDPATLKVLNLSVSGYNEDDRPSLLLADQIAEMIAGGWVIVASAGNNASCRLAWPAALPGVVAVGAISTCAPAWFSNHGPWVDVSAPGVDVVAELGLSEEARELYGPMRMGLEALPDGSGTRTLTIDDFRSGWATWSGTSFSAPFVTALLARHLHDYGMSAADRVAAIDDALDHVVRNPKLDWLPNYGRLLGHGPE